MEENRKLVIAALVIIFGGNAGNIIDATSSKNYRPDPFTGLDGSKLRADMTKIYNSHYITPIGEFERLRQRIAKNNHANI